MKKQVLILLFACLGLTAYCQDNKQDKVTDTIAVEVDVAAQYPGGIEALYKYLSTNLKYPEAAKDKGVQGKVFVSFVIEKDGSVSNIKVLRDIGEGCGDEAIRVVKAMPKWKPAVIAGKAVRSRYQLPISFALPKKSK